MQTVALNVLWKLWITTRHLAITRNLHSRVYYRPKLFLPPTPFLRRLIQEMVPSHVYLFVSISPVLRWGIITPAHLFEVLYSEKERDTELDKGFRGHPSIGASVMAQTVLGNAEPWKTFRDLVNADMNPKVFLAGSIFGGTGASGFPTIAKLIKNELKAVKVKTQIGGALVLPYFTFIADTR